MRPEWVDNDQFFERDWRQFSEISKKMYLSVDKNAKISKIRTGADVRDFTRANFYGMILTADYCEDELRNPKIGFDFNSCIKYFTLSFEKNPDEVLEEAKFITQQWTEAVFLELINIMSKKSSPAATNIFSDLSKIGILSNLLTTQPVDTNAVFKKLKKMYYISIVYNYAIVLIGTKTMVGYRNDKQEVLSYSHPDVIKKFKTIVSSEEWKFDNELTQIAININIFNKSENSSSEQVTGNLIRAIIESIRAELTLLNSTSFVTSKNVKQGMEKELSPEKYPKKVIDFLLENKDLIRNIIETKKRR